MPAPDPLGRTLVLAMGCAILVWLAIGCVLCSAMGWQVVWP